MDRKKKTKQKRVILYYAPNRNMVIQRGDRTTEIFVDLDADFALTKTSLAFRCT